VPDHAAVPGDDPRARPDLEERLVHPRQHAGVDRQALLPRIIGREARSPHIDNREGSTTRTATRCLLQLAGATSIVALAALSGCSKEEKTTTTTTPAGTTTTTTTTTTPMAASAVATSASGPLK